MPHPPSFPTPSATPQMHMPSAARLDLLEAMADTEMRLAYGTSERIQLASLVGSFVQAREIIRDAAR